MAPNKTLTGKKFKNIKQQGLDLQLIQTNIRVCVNGASDCMKKGMHIKKKQLTSYNLFFHSLLVILFKDKVSQSSG